jgi:hypothetical protein
MSQDLIPRPTLLDSSPNVALNTAFYRLFRRILAPVWILGATIAAYHFTVRHRGRRP